MTRCLACEIHVIYRIVLRFTKEAWEKRAGDLLRKLQTDGYVRFEKGNVAVILIDKQLPNQQKRTVKAIAEAYRKMINAEDLDEGFIEIHEANDVLELIDWEIYQKDVLTCKSKKQKPAK